MLPSPIQKRLSIILATVLLILATPPALASDYVANARTGKFHYASCRWVAKMNPGNKVYFNTRDDAVNSGYVPCKVCRP